MSGGESAIVRISRAAIEAGSVDRTVRLFESFIPEKLDSLRNRVRLQVDGYGGEERELFEIVEVRSFFGELFRRYRGLFYWLEASDDSLLLLALLLYEPQRDGGSAWIAAGDMEDFLVEGFRGLEDFCDSHGVSPRPSEGAISAHIRKKIGN